MGAGKEAYPAWWQGAFLGIGISSGGQVVEDPPSFPNEAKDYEPLLARSCPINNGLPAV